MNILLVDDEASIRRGIAAFLKMEEHSVTEASSGIEALRCCQSGCFDLVISDVRMPEMDGLSLLTSLREQGMDVPVIIMTAYATVEDAVRAVRQGADDYLTKPLNLDELQVKIKRLQWKLDLVRENRQLRERLGQLEFPDMIGISKAMRDVQHAIARVARDPDVSVMICGESGTGKELVARAVHARSPRRERRFLAINCGAFSEDLLASELFGYRQGAFTGAVRDKEGIFRAAHRGTLFLDEVGEMSPGMQTKLLRVLQERCVQPVGGTDSVAVDVRIIGASNKDLWALTRQGAFREDLYYRLNVVEIQLPPLREHPEDIPLLIEHYLNLYGETRQKPLRFAQSTHRFLQSYPWPGNVRELENMVRMLLVTCEGETVRLEDLPRQLRRTDMDRITAESDDWLDLEFRTAQKQVLRRFEANYLRHHLEKNDGNISRTAARIGLSRVALHRKLRELDDPESADPSPGP